MKLDVKEIFLNDYVGKDVIVEGWVRNHRKQKEFGFIDFSDGTCFSHLQIVYDNSLSTFDEIQKIKNGASAEQKADALWSVIGDFWGYFY